MEESEAFPVAIWIAHFASAVAAMIVFGASLFPFYTGSRGWPDRWARFIPAALASLVLAAVSVAAFLTFADVTGDIPSLENASEIRAYLLETSFGPVWLARLLLSVLLWAAALRPAVSVSSAKNYGNERAFLILSAAIIVTFAAAGHARSAALQPSAAIAAESVHLIAAGAWLGGLPPLLFFLARAARENRDEVFALPTLHWFSFMGQWSVAIIAIGGASTLAALIAGWHAKLADLSMSGYGVTLMAKLAVLLIMLIIASVNRFVLMPGLGGRPHRLALLRNLVLTECLAGALLLALATALSTMPPPVPMDNSAQEQ